MTFLVAGDRRRLAGALPGRDRGGHEPPVLRLWVPSGGDRQSGDGPSDHEQCRVLDQLILPWCCSPSAVAFAALARVSAWVSDRLAAYARVVACTCRPVRGLGPRGGAAPRHGRDRYRLRTHRRPYHSLRGGRPGARLGRLDRPAARAAGFSAEAPGPPLLPAIESGSRLAVYSARTR